MKIRASLEDLLDGLIFKTHHNARSQPMHWTIEEAGVIANIWSTHMGNFWPLVRNSKIFEVSRGYKKREKLIFM